MLEALVVGIVASVIGMFAGIGLFLLFGKAVPVVADLVGTGSIALHVHPERVVEVVIVGTIVTVVSAAIPAIRAARVRPMAAMRTAAVDRSGTNPFRAVLGLVAIGIGATLLLTGMATHSGTVSGLMIGAGPVFLFIGVLIGGPVLASGFATATGWLLDRFGASSRLAAANSKRNPGRTASTANALIIGMFLVVFVTAAGGGLRDWIVTQADQLNGADLSVTATTGGIPADLQHRIETTPGVGLVDRALQPDRQGQLRRGVQQRRLRRPRVGRQLRAGRHRPRRRDRAGRPGHPRRRPGRVHRQQLRRRPAAARRSFPSWAARSRSRSRTA